jgi:hypothetical protein
MIANALTCTTMGAVHAPKLLRCHMKTCVSMIFVLIFSVGPTFGQSIPLTAKIHQTEQVFVNGQLAQSHTRDGIFLRTSTGMILREWTTIDGKASSGEASYGSLTDPQHGVTYSVDYARRTAHQHQQIKLPQTGKPLQTNSNPTASRETGSVEGLSCTYNPVYVHSKPGETVYGGRACRSEAYNLNLRQELILPAPGDSSQYSKVTEQLIDIHIGEEPDPKLFDLQTFTVYRPDAK